MSRQKSAEAIVVRRTIERRAEQEEQIRSIVSLIGVEAEPLDRIPTRTPECLDGSAIEARLSGPQANPATDNATCRTLTELMEEVVCRENRIEDKRVLRFIRLYLQAGMCEGGVVSARTEGTPQGGLLSPLLSNILLDEWDRELEKRGHRFARYADDCNIYVRSETVGERVLASVKRFLKRQLRLQINESKSQVARPWNVKFLGYSMTGNRVAKLKPAPASVKRFKAKLRDQLRRGRGQSLGRVVAELAPILRGWINYFKLAMLRASLRV